MATRNVFTTFRDFFRRNLDAFPLEDFLTEGLACLLLSETLVDSFVNDVLMVEGTDFQLTTQRFYSGTNGEASIIDMHFTAPGKVIFLENKVEASENRGQLAKYAQLLDALVQEGKSGYLRYCTKYSDHKDLSAHDFRQFLWMDVFLFLRKSQHLPLVRNFLEILESYRMKPIDPFSSADLSKVQHVLPVFQKMDHCLELISRSLGSRSMTENVRVAQRISEWATYGLGIWGVFHARNRGIQAGFNLGEPVRLYFILQCNRKDRHADACQQAALKYFHDSKAYSDAENTFVESSGPLVEIAPSGEFADIERWFDARMNEALTFLRAEPALWPDEGAKPESPSMAPAIAPTTA